MIIVSEIFEVALRSLWRNKLRSILTMLGIIIGVMSVILLISIGSGLQSYIGQQFESLGSNLIYVMPGKIEAGGAATGRLTLTEADVKIIKRLGYSVKDVSPVADVMASARYKNNEKTFEILGLNESGIKMMNFNPDKGRALTDNDVEKNNRVAYIGSKVAEKLFDKENPVGKSILIQSTTYRVIGMYKSKGGGGGGMMPSLDEHIVIPYTAAKRQFNLDKPYAIYVSISDKDAIPEAKKSIEKALLKNHEKDDFSVLGQEELLSTINTILGVLTAGLGGIAAISLLVGGIGIMNIMFVTVTERTKEIGLRKALGARPKDILIQFLIEAITLSFVGGSIGILLALGGSMLMSRIISSEVTLSAMLLAFGFSTAIGVVFGVVPAWKAAKMDPITALRYE